MPPRLQLPSLARVPTPSVLTLALVAALATGGTTASQSLPEDVRREVIPAVVQIIPLDDETLNPLHWSGSGTIISPDGYILTNFHVIGDLRARRAYHWHGIFTTSSIDFADQAPQLRYWAEYVAGDPAHDLALLKITEYADETPVTADVTFPSAPIGDSNGLLVGDPLAIVGYPGISGETITLTSGSMSGWLGEDWAAGGNQWISTDTTIAHGNSGGAVFNRRGELVGVPTAGQTVRYEPLDVEEQAYVRPISLAWALMGPHVVNVNRATPAQGQTGTQADSQDRPQSPHEPGVEYQTLTSGQTVERDIPEADQGAPVFHRYRVDVPVGASGVQVSVDSTRYDLDLALKSGTPPDSSWDDVDHLDLELTPSPSYRLSSPAPGPLYIDVINYIDEPAAYGITVIVIGGRRPGSEASTGHDVGLAESGIVGELSIGDHVHGTLTGDDSRVTYHTFKVEVPTGTATLTLFMEAADDLDLAAKFGSEIAVLGDGGDWDHQDITTSTSATLQIDSPTPGVWYVDVFNLLGGSATVPYTLHVR